MVVNSVISPKEDFSEFGLIIRACLNLLSSFPNFGVSFSRRQASDVVHTLAKATSFLASAQILYHVPPCISKLINNEIHRGL